jgi:hypothetical protein
MPLDPELPPDAPDAPLAPEAPVAPDMLPAWAPLIPVEAPLVLPDGAPDAPAVKPLPPEPVALPVGAPEPPAAAPLALPAPLPARGGAVLLLFSDEQAVHNTTAATAPPICQILPMFMRKAL